MKFLYLVFSWVISLIALLFGLVMLAGLSKIASICLFTISIILFPPARNFVYEKTKLAISVKIRSASCLALFTFAIFSLILFESRETERLDVANEARIARAAKAKQDVIDKFNSNKKSIISHAKLALASNEFYKAVNQTNSAVVSTWYNDVKGKSGHPEFKTFIIFGVPKLLGI